METKYFNKNVLNVECIKHQKRYIVEAEKHILAYWMHILMYTNLLRKAQRMTSKRIMNRLLIQQAYAFIEHVSSI